MLIQRATLMDGRPVDIRLSDQIEEVAEALAPLPAETVFDAAGGAVIPGLHDHHVHLRAAAAAAGSVQVGPGQVHNRAQLAVALAAAPVGGDGEIRAVGYHESVAGPLTGRSSTNSCPGCRYASSTEAVCCGSSTRSGSPRSGWAITPTAGCAAMTPGRTRLRAGTPHWPS